MALEVTGIVFICVIFAISIALVGYCCLRFCASEDKYIRNIGSTNNTTILPPSTPDSTVYGNQSAIYLPTVAPYPTKTSQLEMGSSQVMVGFEVYPKPSYNLLSPPLPGLTFIETQSAPCLSTISPYQPKPPHIGFGYPPEPLEIEPSRPLCPYPVASEAKRTPSPKPEMHNTIYPLRTNSNISENTRPVSGMPYSSETAKIASAPPPPSYAEAMCEQQLPTVLNSAKGEFSEYNPYR